MEIVAYHTAAVQVAFDIMLQVRKKHSVHQPTHLTASQRGNQ